MERSTGAKREPSSHAATAVAVVVVDAAAAAAATVDGVVADVAEHRGRRLPLPQLRLLPPRPETTSRGARTI